MSDEDFQEYRLLIIDALKRLESAQKDCNQKIDMINSQVMELKVKAGLAGAAAGILASAFVSWILKVILK